MSELTKLANQSIENVPRVNKRETAPPTRIINHHIDDLFRLYHSLGNTCPWKHSVAVWNSHQLAEYLLRLKVRGWVIWQPIGTPWKWRPQIYRLAEALKQQRHLVATEKSRVVSSSSEWRKPSSGPGQSAVPFSMRDPGRYPVWSAGFSHSVPGRLLKSRSSSCLVNNNFAVDF